MSSSAPKRQLVPKLGPLLRRGGSARRRGGRCLRRTARRPKNETAGSRPKPSSRDAKARKQQLRSELDAALAKNRGQIRRALRVRPGTARLLLSPHRRRSGATGAGHRPQDPASRSATRPERAGRHCAVTLEKLDTGTKVNLHVHPQEAADWRHYFACQMDDRPARSARRSRHRSRENAASKLRWARPKSASKRSSRKLKLDCSTCSPNDPATGPSSASSAHFSRSAIRQRGRESAEWLASTASPILAAYFSHLEHSSSLRWRGRVRRLSVNSSNPKAPSAPSARLAKSSTPVASTGRERLSASAATPFFPCRCAARLASVTATRWWFGDGVPRLRLSEQLLGRVLDGAGDPIDGLAAARLPRASCAGS
jgi:hypothetical protein